ncbi:hypothetical protein CK203_048247 [Vitis vinifera]|uniref:Uncharacterized protein n=1 Tax=Vitis vinifera TaxID=29760 RepID=A0A438H0I4_VITVI|nr:hypothetical protein CK203_048247 [Vitis vinifera]
MAVADPFTLVFRWNIGQRKRPKDAYARLKQIARLQGKRLPPNPYPSAIKEIQAEERKYVRDRFFNPRYLKLWRDERGESSCDAGPNERRWLAIFLKWHAVGILSLFFFISEPEPQ